MPAQRKNREEQYKLILECRNSGLSDYAVEMAKAHNLNIFNYLTYLLKQRPHENMTEDQLESLAPWSRKAIECCTEK